MLSNMTPIVEGKVQDCCYVAFSESQYLTKGNEGWQLGDYHTFHGSCCWSRSLVDITLGGVLSAEERSVSAAGPPVCSSLSSTFTRPLLRQSSCQTALRQHLPQPVRDGQRARDIIHGEGPACASAACTVGLLVNISLSLHPSLQVVFLLHCIKRKPFAREERGRKWVGVVLFTSATQLWCSSHRQQEAAQVSGRWTSITARHLQQNPDRPFPRTHHEIEIYCHTRWWGLSAHTWARCLLLGRCY